MNISPDEAHQALASVQEVKDRANQTLSWGAIYEVLWGTVWLVGFLVSQFLVVTSGEVVGLTWAILSILGGIISVSLGIFSTRQRSVRGTSGSWLVSAEARVGWFFLALLIYSSILFALFLPLLMKVQPGSLQFGTQISLWWVVTFMFGYAAIGVWSRLPQLIGVGAAVTAIALLGYYLLPGYFNLIMALFGGGTLIGHGLFWLHPWRK